jgi:hypothetical protein
MQNADEIIERVFMMSLSANKSYKNESKNFLTSLNDKANTSEAPSPSTKREKIPGDLQPILESRRFQNSKDKKKYLQRRCRFSWESINEIADETVNQFDDPRYLVLKKYRLLQFFGHNCHCR